MKKFVLLLICGCLIISSHAQDEGLTFYLPFDQGAKAEKAIGDPNPLLDPPYGTIIPGIKGNAVLFNTGNVLRYFTKDNYDNACGSLELWIKYDGMPEKGRYVFMEGRKESEKTHLHISYNIGWKCLVCNHASGLYSKVSLPLEKILGTWSHFVITWDKDIGTRYYLNGRSVPYTGHSGFRGPVLNYKRESRMAETFSVGPRGSKNKNRKMAIDELKI